MSQPTAPQNAGQVVARAMVQVDQMRHAGRPDEAERICRGVLATYPSALPALNYLSVLLGARGELGEAEQVLRRAIALAPQEAALHNNLGNLLHKRNDIEGAAQAYRSAIRYKQDYPEAHYNLGLMLREMVRPDEALEAQRRAIALRPDYAEALTQIGAMLNDQRELDEALLTLDKAIAINPGYFGGHYYRGAVLLNLGRSEEAAVALRRAIELRPQSHEALYALGNALNYSDEPDAALDAYRKAIEANPEELSAHRDYSALAWTMGRSDLALTSYAYARGRLGDTADLMFAEADLRLRIGNAEQARDLLMKAQAAAPDRADIAGSLGRAFITLGRFDDAAPMLERATLLEPQTAGHRHWHAIALLSGRKAVEAERVIAAAREVSPLDQLGIGLATLAYRELNDPRFDTLFDPARFVRTYDLPPPAGFLDASSFNLELAEELAKLHTRKVAPLDQTLRGGTQTMGQLFGLGSPRLSQFEQRLREIIADYISGLPDDPLHPFLSRKSAEFSYAGSWSCRLRSQGFHTNHVHPMGWISSAYYVALPSDVSRSDRNQQGWIKFGESNLNLGARDKPHHAEQPAVGRLVLFPSYFWHGTIPFTADDMRLTIAFDVVPGRGKEVLLGESVARNY